MTRLNPNRTANWRIAALSIALCVGCASPRGADTDRKQTTTEAAIERYGLENDPAIQAQRAAIEAASAREDESPLFDSVELRASAIHEDDTKMDLLARVPIGNMWTAGAQREARVAQTEKELARLSEVTLEQRARLCTPSLDQLVHQAHTSIYERYAYRYRALLYWNQDMQEAGLLDEVSAMRVDLAGRVRLGRRQPQAPEADELEGANSQLLAVLPEPGTTEQLLSTAADIIHRQLVRSNPAVALHRAEERRYAALERRDRLARYPSLRFVDIGYEPIPFSGDQRQVGARASLDVPFGRAARASENRHAALARSERSAERAMLRDRVRETRAAIAEINLFRRRGAHWLKLLSQADDAEHIADRWWKDRLTDATSIAQLLDEVYDARMTVLDAQAAAGVAGCALLESTGTTVEEWPH